MKNEDFRKDRGDGELLKREYLRKLLLRQMIICASKMALNMQLVCTLPAIGYTSETMQIKEMKSLTCYCKFLCKNWYKNMHL